MLLVVAISIFYSKDLYLRCRIYWEPKLCLFPIINRKSFKQECSESRTSSTPKGMIDDKSLKPTCLIRHPSDLIHGYFDLFFTNGVMSSCIIICGIFFPIDKLIWMKQLPIGSRSNLIYNKRLNIAISKVFNSRVVI